MEWGLQGARWVAAGCDVAVVIDVLSFTTTLSVATDRGITVFPHPWRDGRARRFAARHGATLAVGRSAASAGRGQVSLSPASIRQAPGSLRRLVLPSPNGSTISSALAGSGVGAVVGACLRNRDAVARWLLAQRARNPRLEVAVIAAGERWPDGGLRPAVEDLWGAGALVDALLTATAGWTDPSPEAQAAAAAFRTVAAADRLADALAGCASGRELVTLGFADDVRTAAELDASASVPILRGGAFRAAT